jgi:hypothetical protein
MVTYEVTATGPKGYQVTVISPGWQGAIVGDFSSLSAAETFAQTIEPSTPVMLISLLAIPRPDDPIVCLVEDHRGRRGALIAAGTQAHRRKAGLC